MSGLQVDFSGQGSIMGENITYGLSDTNLPVSYRVNIDFTVVHDHVVGWYDGKFAGDGRTNWPLNTGIVINQTADGPGKIGADALGSAMAKVPGPAKLVTSAAQSGKCKLGTKKTDNPTKKGAK
jgi:hypothetical protein